MINTIGEINKRLKTDFEGFIREVDNEYHSQIEQIARRTALEGYKIIMLAGPSGSGKTTTAHLLRDYIRKMDNNCEVVSLDDFYLNKEQMPKNSAGKPDLESVYSLNLPLLEKCIDELETKGETDAPIFDFKNGTIPNGRHINIKNGGVAIIEGIHALNPIIFENLDNTCVLKMYISVNMPLLNDDLSVALSSRTLRLIRRTCRDTYYRDSDINSTLNLWTGVYEGEKKYLYPFKETADIQISTFHSYEPAIFKDTLLKMLEFADKNADNYNYIMKAKPVLEQFISLSTQHLPENSLIREFVPGKKY